MDLIIYNDTCIQLLKKLLAKYEKKLVNLEEEKNDIEIIIQKFEYMYYSELGNLIEKILKFKNKLYKNSNTKKAYDDFRKLHKEVIQEKIILTDDEKKELKYFYRKACKLCHPDLIDKQYQQEANNIFQDLNNAYVNKDLSLVKEIYKKLKRGFLKLKTMEIDTKKLLKSLIKERKKKINYLKDIIETLTSSQAYTIMQNLSNIDSYFETIRKELEDEYKDLKDQFGRNK